VAYTRAHVLVQVFLHALRKVQVAGVVGATTHGALVIKGGSATRRLQCHASNPAELQLQPMEFDLASGQLAELGIVYR
jgi:hypothetical protein